MYWEFRNRMKFGDVVIENKLAAKWAGESLEYVWLFIVNLRLKKHISCQFYKQ